jgi:hypothetical protein
MQCAQMLHQFEPEGECPDCCWICYITNRQQVQPPGAFVSVSDSCHNFIVVYVLQVVDRLPKRTIVGTPSVLKYKMF